MGVTALLKKLVELGDLFRVQACKRGPSISHLFFVDDSLIFCKIFMNECSALQRILKVYEEASGQQLNRAETSLFFTLFSKSTPIEIQIDFKNKFEA